MARRVKPYSGYNQTTPDKLLLDAGAVFINFTPGTDTYESAKAEGKCLGATQKGSEFSAVPQFRRMEIDGVHTRTVGDTLIDGWDVYLKTTLVEMTSDNIKRALGVGNISTGTPTGYDKIQGRDTIETTDYISNVTFVGNILGETDPIIIQVFNAFNESGLTITNEDKNNAAVECQFYGYNDATVYDSVTNPLRPPFAIYRPTITPSSSSSSSQGGH